MGHGQGLRGLKAPATHRCFRVLLLLVLTVFLLAGFLCTDIGLLT